MSAQRPFGPQDQADKSRSLAVAHHGKGELEAALNHYSRALALDESHAPTWSNLGVALKTLGRIGAAEACYRRALALDPKDPGAWTNLGNVLRHQGRLESALACHDKSVKLRPDFADGLYNKGLVLSDLGRFDEAVGLYDKALCLAPGKGKILWDKSLALLAAGRFEPGFALYEERFRRPEARRLEFSAPRWQGEDVSGKTVLLAAEQGFGDTIQFLRYAPLVAARGARVVVQCQEPLVSLAAGVEGVAAALGYNDPLVKFDCWVPLLSLPLLLGMGGEGDIPAGVAYLHPPREAGFPLRAPRGTRFKVGICWAGKPSHRNDRNRSMGLEDMLGLARVPGTALYSLQAGPRAADVTRHGAPALVADLSAALTDFGVTAKVVSQLDLVVSVDTAVAHLAGALGKPVWTLVPFAPDWRWLRGRDDSPWYPSMRLFRQKRPGQWDDVIRAAARELAGTVQGR